MRFKLEFEDLPNKEPFWFDTRSDLNSFVKFIKGCPVDDGPVKLKITEFGTKKVEHKVLK